MQMYRIVFLTLYQYFPLYSLLFIIICFRASRSFGHSIAPAPIALFSGSINQSSLLHDFFDKLCLIKKIVL
jgi:hypothetical protein